MYPVKAYGKKTDVVNNVVRATIMPIFPGVQLKDFLWFW